jgi:hypothetical protein
MRMSCTHGGFHSGQGRYDHGTGMLRYVVVCDDCEAEIAQIRVESYRPSFDPLGNDAVRQGARGGGRSSASNSAS